MHGLENTLSHFCFLFFFVFWRGRRDPQKLIFPLLHDKFYSRNLPASRNISLGANVLTIDKAIYRYFEIGYKRYR